MCGLLLAGWGTAYSHVPAPDSVRAISASSVHDSVKVTVRLKMKAEEHWLFSAAECTVSGWGRAYTEETGTDGIIRMEMQGALEYAPLQLDIKVILADLEFGNREVVAYLSRAFSEGFCRDTVIDFDLDDLTSLGITAATNGLTGCRLLLGKPDTRQQLVMPFASDQMYLLLEKGIYHYSLDALTDDGDIVQSCPKQIVVDASPAAIHLQASAENFHQVSFKAVGLPEAYNVPSCLVHDFVPGVNGYRLEPGSYEATASLSESNPLLLSLARKISFEIKNSDEQVILDYGDYVRLPVEILWDETPKFETMILRVTDGMETDSVTGYSVWPGGLNAFLKKGQAYIWEILSADGDVLLREEFSVTDQTRQVTLSLSKESGTVGVPSLQNEGSFLKIRRTDGGFRIEAPEPDELVKTEIFTAGGVKLLQAEVLPGRCLPVHLRRPGIYYVRLQQKGLIRTVRIRL